MKVERKEYVYKDITSEELDRMVQQAIINDPYDVKLWAKISIFREWRPTRDKLMFRANEIRHNILKD